MKSPRRLTAAQRQARAYDIASAVSTVSTECRGLEALRDALAGTLGDQFSDAVTRILQCTGHVVVTGIGKSGHVGRKIAGTLSSTGQPSHFVHPSDASHGDLGIIRDGDLVIALSWSGETVELGDIIAYTRRFSIPLIAITASADSMLARSSDLVLELPPCAEACPDTLAPTTSTTMQMALGDAFAVALLARRGFTTKDFVDFHPGGMIGFRLKHVTDLMHSGSEVPLVPETASLSEAIVCMTGKRFGMTGVVNAEGNLVGVITDGDLRRAFERGFTDRPAGEVMGRDPRTVKPTDLAHAALAKINQEKITALFVMEGQKPVGVLHVHDLLRAGLL